MQIDPEVPAQDQRLRRARAATLASLSMALLTSLLMPGIGLLFESSTLWIVFGALGILVFVAAQAGALYAAVTPWLSEATRRRLLAAFAAASVGSVPLVGPVGADRWETWAWVGASIAGSAPMLLRRAPAALAAVATLAVAVGVAWWTGGSIGEYAVITVGVGLTVAAMGGLPVWLWDLLAQAQAGRAAQARLVATEERLRFARDVHDLLGHSLSVIALKAELAARLAPIDTERSAQEATDVQRLAGSALAEVRQAVHGYRAIDLPDQLTAIAQVLRSSGVRCTVTPPSADLPDEIATQLASVLREASTNVLRHSKATWCTIDVTHDGEKVRMTVINDGATGGDGTATASDCAAWPNAWPRAAAPYAPGKRAACSPSTPPSRHHRDQSSPCRRRGPDPRRAGRAAGPGTRSRGRGASLRRTCGGRHRPGTPPGRRGHRPRDATVGRPRGNHELATALPSCAVVILTGHGRPQHLQRALSAGAKGFLPKGSPGGTLADVIRRVHAGARYVDPALAADALTAPECPLTPRELDVLRLAEYDTPVSAIAKRTHLSNGTVRNYLAAAISKLGVSTRSEAFRTAHDNGWL